MNILITGIHGFVGSNTISTLKENHTIYGLDIIFSEKEGVQKTFSWNEFNEIPKVDAVIHLAGKAHSTPKTEAEKQAFYDVNYQGTINLCKGLEQIGLPKSFIFVSTVAVYGREEGENISENHPLNGDTPYALSKIQAEQYLMEWCAKNKITLSILRPSLIVGANPPGNLGAMINGIKNGKYLSIAGGKARKSMLIVNDIARIFPALVEKGGIYNVCDDSHSSFRELEILISSQLGKKREPISIPYWLAKSMALMGDLLGERAPINSTKLKKITESLTFSNEKAKKELNWQPLSVLENFKIN